jgi:hypothetical protein
MSNLSYISLLAPLHPKMKIDPGSETLCFFGISGDGQRVGA